MRGGARVGPHGVGMFRGRGFPMGTPQIGLVAGGHGGRTIGALAYWTCESIVHFLRTMQEISRLVEVDEDQETVDLLEVVRQVVVDLEFVLPVFQLFGMNLARRLRH